MVKNETHSGKFVHTPTLAVEISIHFYTTINTIVGLVLNKS